MHVIFKLSTHFRASDLLYFSLSLGKSGKVAGNASGDMSSEVSGEGPGAASDIENVSA